MIWSSPTREGRSPRTSPPDVPRLSRSLFDTPVAAPVRIVHLGVGNFHRAHQAWHRPQPRRRPVGIAAFTGRHRHGRRIEAAGRLYTLITRSGEGDSFELIGALSAVHGAVEHEEYLDYLSRAEVAIITITVTEAAYLRGADGHLDAGLDVIVSDLEALRSDPRNPVASLPARLVAAGRPCPGGCAALTILSCDNLPRTVPSPDGGPRFRSPIGRDLARLD